MLLEDDRRFFPAYLAMPLVRGGIDDSAKRVLEELAGTMTADEMQSLNQSVQEKKSLRDVAAQFLAQQGAARRDSGRRPRRGGDRALDRLAFPARLHPDARELTSSRCWPAWRSPSRWGR